MCVKLVVIFVISIGAFVRPLETLNVRNEKTSASGVHDALLKMANVQASNPMYADIISSIFNINMSVPTTTTLSSVPSGPNIGRPKSLAEMQEDVLYIFNLKTGTPNPSVSSSKKNPSVFQDPNENAMDSPLAQSANSFNLTVERPTQTKYNPNATDESVTVSIGQSESDLSCAVGKICTPQYLCYNGTINSGGISIIDIRMDAETPCPFLETCCSANDTIEKPSVRSQNTPDVCGHRNPEGVGFRISGAHDNEAQFGEFPWMVAILRETVEGTTVVLRHHRGGSLISPKVVLTAAHCIHNSSANTFTVRAGEWEYNSSNEPFPHQDRSVIQTILHENFNMRSLRNDIALMFLASPFELAPNVNTICLPPADFNFDFNRCYVSGWGEDKFLNGQYVNILKKIDVPIVPHSRCQTKLRNAILANRFHLHSSFLCAGGELGKDTCTGDGGSPLVCPMRNHPNRFYQAGIVAWGIGCGNENVPGVYVNVPEFRRWIDSKLADARFRF